MTLTAQAGSWLMQAAATLPDTIVTKPLVAGSAWFTTVAEVARGLVSILLIVLLLVLVAVAIRLWRAMARLGALVDRLHDDITPVTRHAARIADNVEYVTAAVRADVEQVSETVRTANDKARDALAGSERRLKELGALLDLAQDEMERAVVSTAATLRGVRAGAESFREDAEAFLASRGDAELLDEEFDDDDGVAFDDAEEDADDGYDDEDRRGYRGAHPRIRRRPRDGDGA